MQLLLNSIKKNLLDAVSIGTVTSDAFAMPTRSSYVTWQTIFGSTPSAINITIEGSLDNSSWSVIDTSTSTAGAIRSFATASIFVRAKINSVTGGSIATVSLVAKPYTLNSLYASIPASPNQSIQFNNNGLFGGNAGLTWDNVNSLLNIVPIFLLDPALGYIYQTNINPVWTTTADSPNAILWSGGFFPELYAHHNVNGIAGLEIGGTVNVDVGKTVDQVGGIEAGPYGNGLGTVTQSWAFVAYPYFDQITVGEHLAFWIGYPQLSNGGNIETFYGLWSDDLADAAINTYYEWFDSRGVRRVKEDNTFNSVGQAIEALYNPQFTKYTPGASNYERIILGQWNSNVAEIGVEKGGTGVLRQLKLISAGVYSPSGFIFPSSDPMVVGAWWNNAGTLTISAAV